MNLQAQLEGTETVSMSLVINLMKPHVFIMKSTSIPNQISGNDFGFKAVLTLNQLAGAEKRTDCKL